MMELGGWHEDAHDQLTSADKFMCYSQALCLPPGSHHRQAPGLDLGSLLGNGAHPPTWPNQAEPGAVHSKAHKGPARKASTQPKPRLRWTPELHAKFLAACNSLGGSEKATPKQILVHMDIEGLSLFHVKSHLQKYRIAISSGKPADKADGKAGEQCDSKKRAAHREDQEECSIGSENSAGTSRALQEHWGSRGKRARGARGTPEGQNCPGHKKAGAELGASQAAVAPQQEQSLSPPASTVWCGSLGTASPALPAMAAVESPYPGMHLAASCQQLPGALGGGVEGQEAERAQSAPMRRQQQQQQQEGEEGEESTRASAAVFVTGAAQDEGQQAQQQQHSAMQQALSVQMELQKQLQEALEAQHQLQRKLLAHGNLIQRLIQGSTGALEPGPGGPDAAMDAVAQQLAQQAQQGEQAQRPSSAGPGGRSPEKARRVYSRQGSGSGDRTTSGEGQRPKATLRPSAAPGGLKRCSSAPRLVLTVAGPEHGGAAALVEAPPAAKSKARGGGGSAARESPAAVPMLSASVAWPAMHQPTLGLPQEQPQGASWAAGSPVELLFPYPLHGGQQQAQGGSAASMFLDPTAALARLAHGLPLHQLELAALLGTASPLSQAQKDQLLRSAQQPLQQPQHSQLSTACPIQSAAPPLPAQQPMQLPPWEALEDGWEVRPPGQPLLPDAASLLQSEQAAACGSLQAAAGTVFGSQAMCGPSVGSLPREPSPQLPAALLADHSSQLPWIVSQREGGMLCMLAPASTAGAAQQPQHGGAQHSLATSLAGTGPLPGCSVGSALLGFPELLSDDFDTLDVEFL